MLLILPAEYLCLSVTTSALESPGNFGLALNERRETMNTRKVALLALVSSIVFIPVAQAQVKHIEMRVEGMT